MSESEPPCWQEPGAAPPAVGRVGEEQIQLDRSILRYLEESAARYPDKTAFADTETSCTYRELRERAMRIGSGLKRFRPCTPIPVFMEKSVDAICLFMGIVYAGCFYVMLDTKQPAGRLEQILETLQAKAVVSSGQYKKALGRLSFSGEVLDIRELEAAEIDTEGLGRIARQRLDTWPLYGIFTSGSTGVPKGVVVSHRSVVDFIDCFTALFGITSQDVIGNQAPWDFDVSVKDIYATLKTGATMQIIPKQFFSFPTKLMDFLCEREVTTLIWAVSALCMVTTLKGFDYRVPEKIRKVMFSGEVMPIRHLNLWREHLPEALYVNLYGPTEITCNCSYYIVDRTFAPGERLPIGRAFPNERVFLLDEEDQLVEAGETADGDGPEGEICVAGTALALGYYNNPEQTARAFVQNPLNPWYPERIYRTGDMGRYDREGNLVFVGRRDFQIKHMGHRIELGEIERALERTEAVVRACCIYHEEKNRIEAFYEGEIEKKELQRQLRMLVPSFMLPGAYRRVEHLPVTKNGKIDRKLLAAWAEEEREGYDV